MEVDDRRLGQLNEGIDELNRSLLAMELLLENLRWMTKNVTHLVTLVKRGN